jgi:hypothetical protein
MLREGAAAGVAAGYRGPVGFAATSYTDICTAPCDASLPEGSQHLALSNESARDWHAYLRALKRCVGLADLDPHHRAD